MATQTQATVSAIIEDQELTVEQSLAELLSAPDVTLTIDGRPVTVKPTSQATDPATGKPFQRPTTIYDAAQKLGIAIPILCHREHQTPVAVCRFCVVDTGPGRLTPACHRQVENGMTVKTAATSERVKNSVKVLTQLLLADHDAPRQAHTEYGDNELRTIAKQFGLDPHQSPFPRTQPDRGHDDSSLVIAVDHNACILCDRCIRGCNEIRNNQVLGRAGKGYRAHIAFDLDDEMGKSTCVSCGECMVSCPTGALTNRRYVLPVVAAKGGVLPPDTEKIDALSLENHSSGLFKGVARQFLGWNNGSVVRRHFKAGEIVCREGEFGNSAFIIESGELDVFINAPLKHARANKDGKIRTGLFGLVQRFTSSLFSDRDRPREEARLARYIPIDAPVSLELNNPTARLTPDDLIFGEMSCMNNYPRSATVRARTDVVLLEVLRNVLYILQRNRVSKEKLEKHYRERTLRNHLRSVPIFVDLFQDEATFDEFYRAFAEKMQLVRLAPKQVIFRQNDKAEDFYLVKVGFVKVSQRHPGGDHVLTYIGPGGYFGEIGLLSGLPELESMAEPGVRTATCSALDHVDLVKISGEGFHDLITRFPQVKDRLVRVAIQRLRENEASRQRNSQLSLGEFVKQGLMNAQSLLVLDLEKCTRCDECTRACADAHYEPKLGKGITRLIREGLRFENWLVASSCRACLDPYCMVGCPVDSIHRKTTREMIIEDWCIGCGNCANNCPYGNINMHPFPTGEEREDPDEPGAKLPVVQQKATMCDLCSSLDGVPSCVYACPHDAAHRYSGEDFRKLQAARHR